MRVKEKKRDEYVCIGICTITQRNMGMGNVVAGCLNAELHDPASGDPTPVTYARFRQNILCLRLEKDQDHIATPPRARPGHQGHNPWDSGTSLSGKRFLPCSEYTSYSCEHDSSHSKSFPLYYRVL